MTFGQYNYWFENVIELLQNFVIKFTLETIFI